MLTSKISTLTNQSTLLLPGNFCRQAGENGTRTGHQGGGGGGGGVKGGQPWPGGQTGPAVAKLLFTPLMNDA